MPEPLAAAVALYDRVEPRARWHVRLRRRIACMRPVEACLPREGLILELGCGHGLFTHFAALAAPQRRMLGIDIDPRKIEIATRTQSERVRFELGDALAPPTGPFDAVVIVDVLYLLDQADQARVVAAARRVLRPGGWLVWKSQERTPLWKYALTAGQEWLAMRAGLTAGQSLNLITRDTALHLLRDAGFAAPVAQPVSGRIYTDIIYLAQSLG